MVSITFFPNDRICRKVISNTSLPEVLSDWHYNTQCKQNVADGTIIQLCCKLPSDWHYNTQCKQNVADGTIVQLCCKLPTELTDRADEMIRSFRLAGDPKIYTEMI